MARLGASVAMAGRVGSDPFGAQLLKALQADGVDTRLVVVDAGEASGVAFIFLAPDGDNAIVVASGANMRVGADMQQMDEIYKSISQYSALVLQLEIPLETVKNLIAAGQQAGVPVILNLAPAHPLPWDTLRQLTALIVNETEASMLSGQRIDSLERRAHRGKSAERTWHPHRHHHAGRAGRVAGITWPNGRNANRAPARAQSAGY